MQEHLKQNLKGVMYSVSHFGSSFDFLLCVVWMLLSLLLLFYGSLQGVRETYIHSSTSKSEVEEAIWVLFQPIVCQVLLFQGIETSKDALEGSTPCRWMEGSFRIGDLYLGYVVPGQDDHTSATYTSATYICTTIGSCV